jgi:RecA/RadA recombinase
VYPRLVAAEHGRDFVREQAPSGVSGLDALVGGGLDRGTATLVMGPAGTGKSALVTQYAVAAEAFLKATGIADVAYFGPEAEFFVFDDIRFDSTENSCYYFVDSTEGQWNTGRAEGPNPPPNT